MKYKILLCSMLFIVNITTGQKMEIIDDLPFYEVPEYSTEYTGNNVVARMIDGLGFRYRWATEGLTEDDFKYRPSEGARTCGETIDHVLGLTRMILNSTLMVSTDFNEPQPTLNYTEKRNKALDNLFKARENILSGKKLSKMDLEFEYTGGNGKYPFWNQINGPIADALWHSGQIVSFRRASGNPLPKGVQFLPGKKS